MTWYKQIDICTLSVQLYSYITSVNSVFMPDKIINDSDNFRRKSLSYSEKGAILCVIYLGFFVIFDTCDVMYN